MSSSNITVNGRPLKEHLNEEVGKEISQVRASDERLRVRTPLTTHVRRNTSGARTAPGVVVYQAGQRETHVIVAGNLFRWQDKAPFTRSGHSVLGAVEYDDSTDKVKCHTCGEWCQSISVHVGQFNRWGSSTHETIKQYRLRHGFTGKSQLCIPSVNTAQRKHANGRVPPLSGRLIGPKNRRKISMAFQFRRQHGIGNNTENFNLVAKCKAQRLDDLRMLGRQLGRTPTHTELAAFVNKHGKNSLHPELLRGLFKVSVSAVLLQVGLQPRKCGGNRRRLYAPLSNQSMAVNQNVGTRSDLIAVCASASGSTSLQNSR